MYPVSYRVTGGKDNAMKNNASLQRKSKFDPNRDCYLSKDGRYYCYRYYDVDTGEMRTNRIEVGKDVSVEWTIFLDESDHEIDLADRYADEQRDGDFQAQTRKYAISIIPDDYDGKKKGGIDPWETIGGNSVEDIVFASPKSENPQVALVREVIDEKCTEAQQELFFSHFGECRQLESIRQEEAAVTGKLPSQVAMTNRKNKILDKVAKLLGVERVKRCNHKKD